MDKGNSTMTIKSLRILLFLVLIQTTLLPLHAVSLKSVGSWFTSWHNESFYKEIPLVTTRNLTVQNIDGPIVIKTWSLPKLVIEAKKSAKEKELTNITIETDITEQRALIKTVYQDTSLKGSVSYTLMVPEYTNVTIQTETGTIKLKKVHGTINAQTGGGDIEIEHAARSVTAQSKSGPVSVTFAQIPLNAQINLTADYGHISVSLPQRVHASILAKSPKGSITSQQPITLSPITTKLDRNYWKQVKREISGMLGNGGATITLQATNGNIKILSNAPTHPRGYTIANKNRKKKITKEN